VFQQLFIALEEKQMSSRLDYEKASVSVSVIPQKCQTERLQLYPSVTLFQR